MSQLRRVLADLGDASPLRRRIDAVEELWKIVENPVVQKSLDDASREGNEESKRLTWGLIVRLLVSAAALEAETFRKKKAKQSSNGKEVLLSSKKRHKWESSLVSMCNVIDRRGHYLGSSCRVLLLHCCRLLVDVDIRPVVCSDYLTIVCFVLQREYCAPYVGEKECMFVFDTLDGLLRIEEKAMRTGSGTVSSTFGSLCDALRALLETCGELLVSRVPQLANFFLLMFNSGSSLPYSSCCRFIEVFNVFLIHFSLVAQDVCEGLVRSVESYFRGAWEYLLPDVLKALVHFLSILSATGGYRLGEWFSSVTDKMDKKSKLVFREVRKDSSKKLGMLMSQAPLISRSPSSIQWYSAAAAVFCARAQVGTKSDTEPLTAESRKRQKIESPFSVLRESVLGISAARPNAAFVYLQLMTAILRRDPCFMSLEACLLISEAVCKILKERKNFPVVVVCWALHSCLFLARSAAVWTAVGEMLSFTPTDVSSLSVAFEDVQAFRSVKPRAEVKQTLDFSSDAVVFSSPSAEFEFLQSGGEARDVSEIRTDAVARRAAVESEMAKRRSVTRSVFASLFSECCAIITENSFTDVFDGCCRLISACAMRALVSVSIIRDELGNIIERFPPLVAGELSESTINLFIVLLSCDPALGSLPFQLNSPSGNGRRSGPAQAFARSSVSLCDRLFECILSSPDTVASENGSGQGNGSHRSNSPVPPHPVKGDNFCKLRQMSVLLRILVTGSGESLFQEAPVDDFAPSFDTLLRLEWNAASVWSSQVSQRCDVDLVCSIRPRAPYSGSSATRIAELVTATHLQIAEGDSNGDGDSSHSLICRLSFGEQDVVKGCRSALPPDDESSSIIHALSEVGWGWRRTTHYGPSTDEYDLSSFSMPPGTGTGSEDGRIVGTDVLVSRSAVSARFNQLEFASSMDIARMLVVLASYCAGERDNANDVPVSLCWQWVRRICEATDRCTEIWSLVSFGLIAVSERPSPELETCARLETCEMVVSAASADAGEIVEDVFVGVVCALVMMDAETVLPFLRRLCEPSGSWSLSGVERILEFVSRRIIEGDLDLRAELFAVVTIACVRVLEEFCEISELHGSPRAVCAMFSSSLWRLSSTLSRFSGDVRDHIIQRLKKVSEHVLRSIDVARPLQRALLVVGAGALVNSSAQALGELVPAVIVAALDPASSAMARIAATESFQALFQYFSEEELAEDCVAVCLDDSQSAFHGALSLLIFASLMEVVSSEVVGKKILLSFLQLCTKSRLGCSGRWLLARAARRLGYVFSVQGGKSSSLARQLLVHDHCGGVALDWMKVGGLDKFPVGLCGHREMSVEGGGPFREFWNLNASSVVLAVIDSNDDFEDSWKQLESLRRSLQPLVGDVMISKLTLLISFGFCLFARESNVTNRTVLKLRGKRIKEFFSVGSCALLQKNLFGALASSAMDVDHRISEDRLSVCWALITMTELGQGKRSFNEISSALHCFALQQGFDTVSNLLLSHSLAFPRFLLLFRDATSRMRRVRLQGKMLQCLELLLSCLSEEFPHPLSLKKAFGKETIHCCDSISDAAMSSVSLVRHLVTLCVYWIASPLLCTEARVHVTSLLERTLQAIVRQVKKEERDGGALSQEFSLHIPSIVDALDQLKRAPVPPEWQCDPVDEIASVICDVWVFDREKGHPWRRALEALEGSRSSFYQSRQFMMLRSKLIEHEPTEFADRLDHALKRFVSEGASSLFPLQSLNDVLRSGESQKITIMTSAGKGKLVSQVFALLELLCSSSGSGYRTSEPAGDVRLLAGEVIGRLSALFPLPSPSSRMIHSRSLFSSCCSFPALVPLVPRLALPGIINLEGASSGDEELMNTRAHILSFLVVCIQAENMVLVRSAFDALVSVLEQITTGAAKGSAVVERMEHQWHAAYVRSLCSSPLIECMARAKGATSFARFRDRLQPILQLATQVDAVEWTCVFSSALAACSSDDALRACVRVCALDYEFAVGCFPFLIDDALQNAGSATVRRQIGSFVGREFNRLLADDSTNVAIVSLILRALEHCSRTRMRRLAVHDVEQKRRWSVEPLRFCAIDLKIAAAAALRVDPCRALLLSEMAAEDPVEGLFVLKGPILSDVRRILRSAVERVDEPDLIYGTARLDDDNDVSLLVHEGEWARVVARLETMRRSGHRETPENVLSRWQGLQNLGMFATFFDVAERGGVATTPGHRELQFAAAWKLQKWDIVQSSSFEKVGFHETVFRCLNAIRVENSDVFLSSLRQGRAVLTEKLSSFGFPQHCGKELRPTLVRLQTLTDLQKGHELLMKSSNTRDTSWRLRNVWGRPSRVILPSVDAVVDLLEARIVFLQLVAPKAPAVSSSLLDLVRFSRRTRRFQIADNSVFLGNLLPRNDPSVLIEMAKLRRAMTPNSFFSFIQLIQKVALNSQVDEVLRVYALRLLTKWQAESNCVPSSEILRELGSCVTGAESISELSVCSSAPQEEEQYAEYLTDLYGKTMYTVGSFFDRMYRMHRAARRDPNSEYARGSAHLEYLRERVEHFSSRRRMNLNVKERKMIVDEQERIEQDILRLEKAIEEDEKTLIFFLNRTIEIYCIVLSRLDRRDITLICRLLTLWFENSDLPSVLKTVELNLIKVPSGKFIPLVYQIASRLGSDEPTFSELLLSLLRRLALAHPHHTLWPVFALSRGDQVSELQKNRDRFVFSEAKVDSATNFLKELLKTPLHETILQMEQLIDGYVELSFYNARGHKEEGNTSGLRLTPELLVLKNLTCVPIPTVTVPIRMDGSYVFAPYVVGFEPKFDLPGGITIPKKIRCIGSDGKCYLQLVKGGDDLRQDAVMEQLYGQMNGLLSRSEPTRVRELFVRTYKVVPLTPVGGVLEWVDQTVAFGNYLVRTSVWDGCQVRGAHERYRPRDMPHSVARQQFSDASKKGLEAKGTAYRRICENFRPVFHHFFLERFSEPAEWFARRLSYTRSVAVNSMAGYCIGLGDRHVVNILIDTETAECIHIDLGVAFDQAKQLHTPECVPFRLTRDIVDGMGITGVEGVFRRCCEHTLRVFRTHHEALRTIADVFLHDPLYRWSLDSMRALHLDRVDLNDSVAQPHSLIKNLDAEQSLNGLAQRIQGRVGGESLSVEGQVQHLIQEAMDPSNLCRMFHGWVPWV